MSDFIRYAFGKTSLGEVMVAASDRGVVAFEFVDDRNVTEELLSFAIYGHQGRLRPDGAVIASLVHKTSHRSAGWWVRYRAGLARHALRNPGVEFASRNRGRRDDELRSARCEIGHARRARRDCSDQY